MIATEDVLNHRAEQQPSEAVPLRLPENDQARILLLGDPRYGFRGRAE